MQRTLWCFGILVGSALMSMSCLDPGGVAQAADWAVIWDDAAAYGRLEGEEIILQGEVTVENYGEPGVKYVRAPLRYWLRTESQKLAMSPPRDAIFMRLDGKIVEVKGKIQQAPDAKGHDTLWVRMIRPTE